MSLERLKNHLHVEHCEDDEYIEFLYRAVRIVAENYIDCPLVDDPTSDLDPCKTEKVMNESIEAAIYVGVAHLYENRGDSDKGYQSVTKHDLPKAFHWLLINERQF